MTILTRMIVLMAALMGVLGLNAGIASADTCTTGNCYTIPASPTTTTITSSSSSVKIHIKKLTKISERINQYERHRNVIVLVHQRAGGVKSQRGCVDPMAKGWIGAGQYFDNSGGNHRGYWTGKWKAGQQICHATRRKIGKTWYMVGWKDNCSNHIRIRLSGPSVFKKYIPILEVRSLREFSKIYEEWYEKTTSSTGSTTTTTTYSCTQGTLVSGNMCQICPPPTCVPTPTQPSYACVGLVVSPNSINVGQSVNATTSTTSSGGASFNSVNYDWGDGSSTRGGQTASHAYGAAGTYTVVATARFNLSGGGTVDVTSAACRAQVTVTSPPAPTPTHFTQISCQFPPHIIVGGSQFMYCVAANDNGALISTNAVTNNEVALRASEKKQVNQRNQAGDPCPPGAQCFRWTLYAGSITGFFTVRVTATSNGVDATPATGTVEVAKDSGFGG